MPQNTNTAAAAANSMRNVLPTVNWLMGLSATSTSTGGLDLDQKGRRCRRTSSSTGSSSSSRSTPYDRIVPQYHAATSDHTEDGEDLDASRPQFSFTCLIGLAVLSSPEKRLSVGQVYDFISKNFPFYKTAKGTWRNSVRHVLSLNKFFQKVAGGPAKGGVWEMKPQMLTDLLEHIAEGQQRLPEATCRHLGLPQLKKRVIKSRIGRGRSSWSACSAPTFAATAPPPPPPASFSWGGGTTPLSFDLDMDELDTLAALQSDLDSDSGSESMCSSSSSSVFAQSMDSVASDLSVHSMHSMYQTQSVHTVPELDDSEWAILPPDDDILDCVFGQLDAVQVQPSNSCQQAYLPALSLSMLA